MRESRFEHVIFDLDGTLVDSLGVTFHEFRRTIIMFSGREYKDEEILSLFGPSEVQIFENLFGKEKALEAYKFYKDNFIKSIDKIKVFDGIDELLNELKGRGMKVGLFTGRGKELTVEILKRTKIIDYFNFILSSEEVKRPKPYPDGILKLIDLSKTKKEKTIYVGDSIADVKCGVSSDVSTGLALWGGRAIELNNYKPDFLLQTPSDILKLI